MLATRRLQQVWQKRAHPETIAIVVALDDVVDREGWETSSMIRDRG